MSKRVVSNRIFLKMKDNCFLRLLVAGSSRSRAPRETDLKYSWDHTSSGNAAANMQKKGEKGGKAEFQGKRSESRVFPRRRADHPSYREVLEKGGRKNRRVFFTRVPILRPLFYDARVINCGRLQSVVEPETGREGGRERERGGKEKDRSRLFFLVANPSPAEYFSSTFSRSHRGPCPSAKLNLRTNRKSVARRLRSRLEDPFLW